MGRTLLIALRMTAVTLVLTGFAYPLLVTGLAQALFPSKANGSLVLAGHGAVAGSSLIGQAFSHPEYAQPRPSAAGDKGYDALSSSGSNLGPTSKKLKDRMASDVALLLQNNPGMSESIPDGLVTASGSGLDPDVSPEAALWQAPRIARARHVDVERVRRLIRAEVEPPLIGVLGEPRVNVLLLNLAMDRQFGSPEAVRPAGG